MATVHIPMTDLTEGERALLERVPQRGEIVIDGEGGRGFRILPTPVGRTAAEILADPTIRWSDSTVDEDWNVDLEAIIAERKLDRDPWAE